MSSLHNSYINGTIWIFMLRGGRGAGSEEAGRGRQPGDGAWEGEEMAYHSPQERSSS